jgi:hypothetical protein
MREARRRESVVFETAVPGARRCDHPGCLEPGEFRAPRSRERLNDYYWFCLGHVRDYNRSWNYYAGLSDAEVERMIRFDTVWQRPTWPMGGWRAREEHLRRGAWAAREGFGPKRSAKGGRAGAKGPGRRPHPMSEEQAALDLMDLDPGADLATVKARYKTLVKRHHPDANGGSREAEEKLKSINHAYGVLKAALAS